MIAEPFSRPSPDREPQTRCPSCGEKLNYMFYARATLGFCPDSPLDKLDQLARCARSADRPGQLICTCCPE